MSLKKILYNPITSTPFKQTAAYNEYEPCEDLKPFIRCFWGSCSPFIQTDDETLVTPDSCVDVIFKSNYTDNTFSSGFCGIDDRSFISQSPCGKTVFTFGIRFYAWGVAAFAEDTLKNTKNAFYDADVHFSVLKKTIEPLLFDIKSIMTLIPIAEQTLLKTIREKQIKRTVIDAIAMMLEKKGNINIGDISSDTYISERQLERLFGEYVGCSVKCLASLIRYQYLWNDIVFDPCFDIMDAVIKYGYSDQSHLSNDFRKYHSMCFTKAKAHAFKNVGNLQDSSLYI